MQFAIKYANGLFLKRNAGYARANRSLVADINEATLWPKAGAAKNAARSASETNSGVNVPGEVAIVPVFLQVAGSGETYNPRKSKSHARIH